MDIRVLKNLVHVALSGSFSAASERAHLTIQALASQVNKAEDAFGFKLFERTNKGVSLTKKGKELLPYIEDVIKASNELNFQAALINRPRPKTIHIALNSTFEIDLTQEIIKTLMAALDGYKITFSSSETPENIDKMKNGIADMAVVIGRTSQDFHSIPLKGLKVKVVTAYCDNSTKNTIYPTYIQPLPECPYSESFNRFVNSGLPVMKGRTDVIQSGSEMTTISLIKNLNSIGLVSYQLAKSYDLKVIPAFEDVLDVMLIMKHTSFSNTNLDSFSLHDFPSPQSIKSMAHN